jgi:pimeloyl-ACP methyl ester carboxylesterase
MNKLFIKNRKNQHIAVLLDEGLPQVGLAFVMHGLGGFKEQDQIKTFSEAFSEKDFTVVRFDTANTIGESDGSYEDATVSNYYEDLVDVIEWAKGQMWYQEPFYLAGHSLGALSVTLYAERHAEHIRALLAISPVVSGSLSVEAYEEFRPEVYEQWKESGWLVQESNSKVRVVKRLKWSHMVDRLKYDLLKEAKRLLMPVLLIVGSEDITTLPKHVELLFNELPEGHKAFKIISGAPHTFREPIHLQEVKKLILDWISDVDRQPK